MSKAKENPGYELTIDLDNQTVSDGDGFDSSFEIDEFRKYCLVNGLDDIGLILKLESKIADYENTKP